MVLAMRLVNLRRCSSAPAAPLCRRLPSAAPPAPCRPRGVNATSADAISFGGLTFAGTTDGAPVGTSATELVPANGGGDFSFELMAGSLAVVELPLQ